MALDKVKTPTIYPVRPRRREWQAAEATQRAFAVDAELVKLLPGLQRAEHGRVVVLAQFRRVEFVRLIPFQLHARWPDALPWLPLTATVAVIPFNTADVAVASLPLYRVSEVRAARRVARQARLNESRHLPNDFVHPDWEDGAARLRARLDHVLLPPSAFVCIERVRFDGSTIRTPRPILGRHAVRNAPRPRVLIPGGREISARATATLANADLVVIDIQRLRGRRSLQVVRAVLAARSPARPTLIVASSPSDLFAVGLDEPPLPDQLVLVGSEPQLEAVEVLTVGGDRLVADARFHAALTGLAGQSTAADRLLAVAENAWWAARQALDPQSVSRELQRFERALDDLAREDPLTAGLFTTCRDLLHATAADASLRAERGRAAISAVLNPGTPDPVLVVTPRWNDAAALRAAVAAELDLNGEDLEALNVWVRTVHAAPPHLVPELVILPGYAGMATIDATLASGSRRVLAIFDPVEARAAWYNAQRMADYLHRAGAAEAANPLLRLADEISPHVVGFAPVRELLSDEAPICGDGAPVATLLARPVPNEAVVCLTDGTWLEVPLGARFEILGRKGLGSRVVAVTALEPGDQIVLLDEEGRTLLSEQRIATLDAGVLKEHFQARSEWLAIVRAVAKAKKLTPAAIVQGMTERGYRLTSQAIKGWLDECSEKAHAPMRLDHFLALAEVLGLAMSEETLRHYYRDIRTWRIQHRRAGREVARAIRLARSGRLGPVTLARIERSWGVGVRAVIDAARIGVVDEVILPGVAEGAGSQADG